MTTGIIGTWRHGVCSELSSFRIIRYPAHVAHVAYVALVARTYNKRAELLCRGRKPDEWKPRVVSRARTRFRPSTTSRYLYLHCIALHCIGWLRCYGVTMFDVRCESARSPSIRTTTRRWHRESPASSRRIRLIGITPICLQYTYSLQVCHVECPMLCSTRCDATVKTAAYNLLYDYDLAVSLTLLIVL